VGLTHVFATPSSLVAEALTVRDALVFAYNLDMSGIMVVCCLSVVVHYCKGKLESGKITSIIKDIFCSQIKIFKV